MEGVSKRNIQLASIFGGSALITLGLMSYWSFRKEEAKVRALEKAAEDLAKDIYDDETILKIYKQWSKDLYPVYNVIQIKARELLRQLDMRGPRPANWQEQLIMVLTQRGKLK